MQKYNVIIAVLSFIIVWCDSMPSFPIKPIRWIRARLDFKPFNCPFCLSFWIGLILCIALQDITYLGLPVYNKVLERIIY